MNTKRNPSLDEVLADYAGASQEFDAEVLQAYIDRYPDYARALQRFAQVQLTSVPATPEEVDNEPVAAPPAPGPRWHQDLRLLAI